MTKTRGDSQFDARLPGLFRERFVERPTEMTALGELVGRSATQFALITGDPQIGKTWLALRFAMENARNFPQVLNIDLSHRQLSARKAILQLERALINTRTAPLVIIELSDGHTQMALIEGLLYSRAPKFVLIGEDIPRNRKALNIYVPPFSVRQAEELVYRILGPARGRRVDVLELHSRLMGHPGAMTRALEEYANLTTWSWALSNAERSLPTRARLGVPTNVPIVQVLPNVTPQLLAMLKQDPSRLRQMSPERFEELVADRFEKMGYSVSRAGDTFRKDGGVDLVASKRDAALGEFLVAGQVKHHAKAAKVGSQDVQRLVGLKGGLFSFGVLATNTTFTEDARFVAAKAENKWFTKLRDIEDVKRWLVDNFKGDFEHRELPDEIELAPGIKIKVPRPNFSKLGLV